MGVCVKLASEQFSTSEIVMYRGVVGVTVLFTIIKLQGGKFTTTMPGAHLWRGLVGVVDDPKNPKGIVLSVDVLQQGLLVRMPLADLQLLP